METVVFLDYLIYYISRTEGRRTFRRQKASGRFVCRMQVRANRVSITYDNAICVRVCTASEEMAARLFEMLRRWACAECVVLSAERTDVVSFGDPGSVQLLILDMDSMEPTEKMPTRHADTGLILISGDAGRAIRSYRWHPSAFLKPDFDRNRLADAMNACERYLQRGRLGLESPQKRRSFRLPLGRVRYVEAARHYCLFNQGKTSIRLRYSVDELEQMLPGPPFVRCHRSYLVHLGYVTGLTYTAVMLRGGVSIPLGRTYISSVRKALEAWQRGEYPNDDFNPGV